MPLYASLESSSGPPMVFCYCSLGTTLMAFRYYLSGLQGKSANPVTKVELGRATWTFVHTLAAQQLKSKTTVFDNLCHNASYLTEMLNLAKQWGWTGNDTETHLGKLLKQMIDESDPKLPFGYIKLDEVARHAKINSPPLRTMMSALNKEGYAVSRSHIASNAIKTNCPMAVCIRIAKELQQC
ncbi:hypothetical protein VitviT2T_002723 [Vitis vinifera]|uniref:Uncharacterized protein n=1 Tax=Vitis vinifera TaxID=29760 RepID=A0ABY9BKS8_VITVI|nr:hypothetical protein VitviT2T_002723 [Vitis vinifera]